MKTVRPVTLLTACLLVVGVVSAVHAAEPEDIIKYRKNSMKASGAHMGAANAILTGKVDFRHDLAGHASALAALNHNVASLFPKDSDFGDTNARDEVWKKSADFKKHSDDARARADDFMKAVATNDKGKMTAAFGKLNDACKACHKDFRKEEK